MGDTYSGEIQSDQKNSDIDLFHTARGQMMKKDQKQIVTGMDKLVNPKMQTMADTLFDSSPSRDINVGSVENENGINYKALKLKGDGGIFR